MHSDQNLKKWYERCTLTKSPWLACLMAYLQKSCLTYMMTGTALLRGWPRQPPYRGRFSAVYDELADQKMQAELNNSTPLDFPEQQHVCARPAGVLLLATAQSYSNYYWFCFSNPETTSYKGSVCQPLPHSHTRITQNNVAVHAAMHYEYCCTVYIAKQGNDRCQNCQNHW